MREAFYGILIPFLGTSLGAACVFFMKKTLSDTVQRALTGFAAGVMVAASVWSLLIPAIEQSVGMGKFAFVPAVVGFYVGMLFLLAARPCHSSSACETAARPKARRARLAAHNHDGARRHAAQHSGRHGRRRGLCGLSLRSGADHGGGRAGIVAGHRHSELSGGRDHLHAAPRGRHGQGTRIRRRRAFRHRRTHRRGADRSRREDRLCPLCRICSALPRAQCSMSLSKN